MTVATPEQASSLVEIFGLEVIEGGLCQDNAIYNWLILMAEGIDANLWEVQFDRGYAQGETDEDAHMYLELNGVVYNKGVTLAEDNPYPDLSYRELQAQGADKTHVLIGVALQCMAYELHPFQWLNYLEETDERLTRDYITALLVIGLSRRVRVEDLDSFLQGIYDQLIANQDL